MCGICGVVTTHPDVRWQGHVEEMSRSLFHRGPDSDGFCTDEAAGLYMGFRRLSIIDLSDRGRQPMLDKKANLRLVFNGEIYNYRDLRSELQCAGYKFSSDTDTEVVLHGYHEWGLNVLKRLRGMFAFALWDKTIDSLCLARDRLGIKPLYYLNSGNSFVFASEAKAFRYLPADVWRSEIDLATLRDLLALGYLADNERSVLKGIRKVRPGHVLVWCQGEFAEQPYWQLPVSREVSVGSYEEEVQEGRRQLSESVRLMLHADVEVGILLSGGIDSSLVTALAQKHSTTRVRTFTVGYDHAHDERKYAQLVSDHVGTFHTSIELDLRSNVFERMSEFASVYDDLSSLDGGFISTYLIAEQIRRTAVKVVLVGEGGDEVFGGYPPYFLSLFPFNSLPLTVRSALHYYAFSHTILAPGQVGNFLDFRRLLDKSMGHDVFKQITKFELCNQLPSNYLMKVDKATMAHSLEARVPYLDEKVVEYGYSLPASYKMQAASWRFKSIIEKRILRDIARPFLPTEILRRRKLGFSLPENDVLIKNEAAIRETLLGADSLARQVLSSIRLQWLLRLRSNRPNRLQKWKDAIVWRLFLANAWWRAWERG